MHTIDANIFLEVELGQERSEECEKLLDAVAQGKMQAVISDFHVDSIIIVMESHGIDHETIRKFLVSLTKYSGLQVYYSSLDDRIKATNYMRDHKLDFDDAFCVQCAIANQSTIISFDRDFDKVSNVKRLEPKDLLT